jgi:aminopeptidase S
VSYLNLNMAGSPHPRPVVYAARADRRSRRLGRLLLAGLRREGVRARPRPVESGSDHVPFQRAGIPVAGLFTGAGRPADACYHRACDDLSNVDVETTRAMAVAARWAVVRATGAP